MCVSLAVGLDSTPAVEAPDAVCGWHHSKADHSSGVLPQQYEHFSDRDQGSGPIIDVGHAHLCVTPPPMQ
jgi:hypothetical protein